MRTLFRRFLIYSLHVVLVTGLTLIWGAMFWMNPLPYRVLKMAPRESDAGKVLLENFPESGTYLMPGFYTENKNFDRWREGPLVMLYFDREGESKPFKALVRRGILLNVASIAVSAFLLWRVLPKSQTSYPRRVLIVAGFGSVSAFFSHGADVIWWFHPVDWHFVVFLYTSIFWVITGSILAIDPERIWQHLRNKGQKATPGGPAPVPAVALKTSADTSNLPV